MQSTVLGSNISKPSDDHYSYIKPSMKNAPYLQDDQQRKDEAMKNFTAEREIIHT